MLRLVHLIGFRHLRERPLRTGLTVLGIALGVAVSVAIQTANEEVLLSFKTSVLQIAGGASLQVTGGELGVDEQIITMLQQHPAVIAATPVLQQAAWVAAGPHAGRTVVIMGLDLLEASAVKGIRLGATGGSEVTLDPLLERNAVFLGEALAAELGAAVGDTLEAVVGTKSYRLVVRGLVLADDGARSVWRQMAVMDIAAAQALFGLVGKLDRIELLTEPGRPIMDVATDLKRRLPPGLTITRPAQRNEQVERLLRAMQVNLSTLGAVGLLIGLLLVYNTVSFTVVQRRREIGLYRALGMKRSEVTLLFLAEAGTLGLAGGILGSALGILLAHGLLVLLSGSFSELYASISQSRPGMSLGILRRSDLWGQGCVLGILVSMLGATGPSFEAGKTSPARALAPGDYEATQEMRTGYLAVGGLLMLLLSALLAIPGPVGGIPIWGYASAFGLLLGLACLAPIIVRVLGAKWPKWQMRGRTTRVGVMARIAVDQISRSPGRNSVTVSALMVGLTVMIGVGIMISSFRQTVEQWIQQTILADLVVAPTSWLHGDDTGMLSNRLPLAWTQQLALVLGVAAVDPYRQITVQIRDRSVSLVARDLALHAKRSRYLFMEGESSETLRLAREAEGVVVSEVLAQTLMVKQGDTLHIETPSGLRQFPILGVFYDYATDGGKLVMDSGLYRRLWHDDTVTVLAAYVAADASPTEVRQRILNTLAHEQHVVVVANAELRAEILAIFDRTFRVTYALELIAVVIGLLGIVNTLLTSVLERQRELATLRAIGASRAQISGLILWESSWLGLVGAALGVVGGLLLSVLLIEVINKQSFGWTIHRVLPLGLLAQAVGLALIAALAAGYFPARWAATQSSADGLRYE